MSGHTPGPWWISHAETVEGHPMVVAGHGHDHGLVAEVLTVDDAKLIASLPALVAERDALRKALERCQQHFTFSGDADAVEMLSIVLDALSPRAALETKPT